MDKYEEHYSELRTAQRLAVDWQDGSLLVLAGPGSGKTKVLTSRIARLLRESPGDSFRVLALTFTNKAADEMKIRALDLCSEVDERASIGTFHSFCMQMLQQHGSHLGIQPDFTIYSQDADRREILKDGLRNASEGTQFDDYLDGYLKLIDRLKGMLVDVDSSASKFRNPEDGARTARVYAAYESELSRINALDFNSLIMKAYQLVNRFSGVALRYRKTYRYWMLDEFQDTNRAQYKFLKALAGAEFKNIFAVADDDQIIYQWNGASFAQLQKFRADFNPELVQLPTNFRCPAPIVNAANNLVRHNTTRSAEKLPLEAGKLQAAVPAEQSILLGKYDDEFAEASAIGGMILSRVAECRSSTVVLARNKALLDKIQKVLVGQGIPATVAQRKDDFSSAQFKWISALLRQVVRPQDVRNFRAFVSAYDKLSDGVTSIELLIDQASTSGRSLLDEWLLFEGDAASHMESMVDAASVLLKDPRRYAEFIATAKEFFASVAPSDDEDFQDDLLAWESLDKLIAQNYGRNLPLDQFMQHMALQSKEPPPRRGNVSLMTIHAAKGKEFDYVFLAGLAEEVLPSYQSIKAGQDAPEMEEERRNCFVAITRTQEQLVLTWAAKYNNWSKKPSRFLAEMGFDPNAI